MIDELRICYKCFYETNEVLKKCPKCGRGLFSKKQVRLLGWLILALGMFLVGLMGTITIYVTPALLYAGAPTGGKQVTATAEQATLILALFGSLIAAGLIFMVTGLWQIKTGRRNKWLVYSSIALIGLVVIAAVLALKAIGAGEVVH
jgi:MFS family permease